MKIKKNVFFCLYFILLLIGCTTNEETVSVTQVTSTPSVQEIATDVPTKSPPTSTILPLATPTPVPTETPIPPLPTPVSFLEDVSDSDLIWAPIVQRINELQGFYAVAISPDGKLLAVVDRYDEFSDLFLLEIETNSVKWLNDNEHYGNSGLVFSTDGKLLANSTSTITQDVFVLDVANGDQLHHFLYQERPSDMAFAPDSQSLIMSGRIPGATIIWDLENNSETEIDRSLSIEFLPESEELVLAIAKGQKHPDEDSPVFLLNLQTDNREYVFSGGYFSSSVAISPDGKYLAANVTDMDGWGNVRLLDLQGNIEVSLEGEEQPMDVRAAEQISFSNNGYLAALQSDLSVWQIDGELLGVIDGLDIAGFLFTPDGKYLITYGSYQTPMQVWELPNP